MLNKLTTKYFEWGEKLGKGGFGTVFQAYSKVLKMQVAVKVRYTTNCPLKPLTLQ